MQLAGEHKQSGRAWVRKGAQDVRSDSSLFESVLRCVKGARMAWETASSLLRVDVLPSATSATAAARGSRFLDELEAAMSG